MQTVPPSLPWRPGFGQWSAGPVRRAFVLFILLGVCPGMVVGAPTIPDEIRRDLGKAGRRTVKLLESPDLADRLEGLNSLIAAPVSDSLTLELKCKLKPETLVYVIRSFLAEDWRRIPAEPRAAAVSGLSLVAMASGLKEMGKPMAALLAVDDNVGSQLLLLETLRTLKAYDCVLEVLSLLTSPHAYLRREALTALVEWNAREAIPHLLRILDPPDHQTASPGSMEPHVVLEGLVKLRATEAAPVIAILIRNPQPDLEYSALDALYQLGARDQAAAIRPLLAPEVILHTRAYAIAVSLAFDQADALPLAITMVTAKEFSVRSDMMEKLFATRPPMMATAAIQLLSDPQELGGDTGTDSNIRRALMGYLTAVGSNEAIPILRKYAQDPRNGGFLQDSAVEALGGLRARESAADLLAILHRRNNAETSKTGKTAVALARMGDPNTWPELLAYADSSRSSSRREVMNELNFFLDPALWERIHRQKITGWAAVPRDQAARVVELHDGTRVALHVAPPFLKLLKSVDSANWPSRGETLANILQLWLGPLGGLRDPRAGESFCYLFDGQEIHLMPVSSAVARWRVGGFPGTSGNPPGQAGRH